MDIEHRKSLHTTISSLSPSSPSSTHSTIPKIRAGDGQIAVEFDPYRGHTFPRLSYTYPLKLLSLTSAEHPAAIVYVLSYGGGLVGGDEVGLEVAVRQGASLMLLSQVRPSPISYLRCGRMPHLHPRFFVVRSRRAPQKCSRIGSPLAPTSKDERNRFTRTHPPRHIHKRNDER